MTNSDTTEVPQWYLARDGKRFGPIEQDKFTDLIQRGQVRKTDLVWQQGFSDWIEAQKVPGLFSGTADPALRQEPRFEQSEERAEAKQSAPRQPGNKIGQVSGTAKPPVRNQRPAANGHGSGTVSRSMEDQLRAEPRFEAEDRPKFIQSPGYRSGDSHGGSWAKRIAGGFAVLLFMGVMAVVALPFVVPADFIRDRIALIVKEQTGRDFAVRGRTSFTFFPNIGVELNDVSLSNPPGMSGEQFAKIAVLKINLKLIPLLSRQLEVDHFILNKPEFALFRTREGEVNWRFGKSGTAMVQPSDTKFADTAGERSVRPGLGDLSFIARAHAQDARSNSGLLAIQDLKLGSARIIDGSISYTDQMTEVRQRADKINIAITLPQLRDPLDANGDFVWKEERIEFVANVQSPIALLNTQASPLKLVIEAKPVSGSIEGEGTLKDGFNFKGTGAAQSGSLRSLVHWLEGELPNTRGYGAFDVSSKLEMRGNEIIFDNAKLKLDETNAVASGRINLSGPKPVVNAKVAADQIDLSAYISAFGETATRKSQGLANQDRRSLTNLIESINQPNSQVVVTGSTAKSNLDRAAKKSDRAPTKSELSIEGLDSANLDVNFQLEKLLFSNIQIDQSNIDVRLKDGLLSANLKKFGLYGGQGQGQVKIDSRKSVPGLSSVVDIKGVSALPFLKDAANFDWISGKTRLAIDVVGSGKSDQEIRSSLQGKGSILFEDGAIEGINIPQIMRAFQNGRISGWSREPSLKTDFSELSGTFTIDKGVANNSDLQLRGPLLRLTGGGEVNIVKENLDYVVRPKLVASLEGQGGQQSDLQGLEVPVRIKGPWKTPRISPDIEGIVNDPAALTNTIDNAAKAIKKLGKNKDFESMIKGVLNGQSDGNSANQPEGQSFNANEILEQLTR